MRYYERINEAIKDEYAMLIFNKPYELLQIAERDKVFRYQTDHNRPVWEYIMIDGSITNYSVNKIGQVRNNTSGRILKWDFDKRGYAYVILYIDINGEKKSKTIKVHRLVAQAFIPNPENKPQVNHINGKKDFNWVGNLEWVTAQENVIHAYKTGLRTDFGENNNTSKYSESQIHEICKLLETGMTPTEVARKTGMPVYTVSNIKAGINWKHIASQYNIPKPVNTARPQEFRDYIIELIMAGYSNKEIAAEMDLPLDNPIKSTEYVGLIRRRFYKSQY